MPKGGRPEGKDSEATEKAEWDLKTFGFFDRLRITQEPTRPVGEEKNGDRYKRTLIGWGDRTLVRWLLDRADENKTGKHDSGYLAVCLVRLTEFAGHAQFQAFTKSLVDFPEGRVAYLLCLDAPDLIVLSTFGDKTDPQQDHPLARLLEWSESIRQKHPLAGNVERLLTIVACYSQKYFSESLAARDPDPRVTALVRITDMCEGKALPELLRRIKKDQGEAILARLRTTVGYYDVQGQTSVPEAGRILDLAIPRLVEHDLLTTSTCFMSPSATPPDDEVKLEPHPGTQFLSQLQKQMEKFKRICPQLLEEGCLNPRVYELVAETVGRFERLHTTGLIPGSRLLIWTAYDVIGCLTRECADHLKDRAKLPADEQRDLDDEAHQRQRDYAAFLGHICDELDHRIALSLAAYTRFFPCSIEVPLKVVGALDMASRLIAASFRCYRCREEHGLLQVFIAKALKPSEFFRLVPKRMGESKPYPTLVLTMFSPTLVRHFYLALFIVLHEVAQCIIAEMIEWPSFTTLVFSQAFAERIAVISTLARRSGSVSRLPPLMQEWANRFLAEEIAATRPWREMDTRVGPEHFVATGSVLRTDPKEGWEEMEVWSTDAGQWQVKPVDGEDEAAATHCHQLFRDARLLDFGVRELANPTFRDIWIRRLEVEFRPDGNQSWDGEESFRVWSDDGVNSWKEYLELASLIPFLRLFEDDRSGAELHSVVVELIHDYWTVWRDSEEPALAYDAARRFAIAEAANTIFQAHLDKRGVADDCRGDAANAAIMSAVQKSAAALLKDLPWPKEAAPHAQASCRAVWEQLATPEMTGRDERAIRAAQPLIVQCMVRFLVRLLHVYRTDGPNVRPNQGKVLVKFNHRGKKIFLARQQTAKISLPVPSISFLWALQYLVSESDPEIGYLLSLEQVVGLTDDDEL